MSKGSRLQIERSCAAAIAFLAIVLALPAYMCASLWYSETKGPFKNQLQVVDLEGDGNLDLIVSHTRWEKADLSWAGIGLWVNRGNGTFELQRDRGTAPWPFSGFAAAAGDVDRDGDLDVFTQDFRIRLLIDQGGLQEGKPGRYASSGGIAAPSGFDRGYRDMGGTITLGDLNGDSLPDAFVAGCCYGLNAGKVEEGFEHAASVSWVWLNDGRVGGLQTGHILPLDFLDGLPIREAALGDLDGDGDLDVYAAVGAPTLGTVNSQRDLILLNDGTGNLSPHRQPSGDRDSLSVALADVNGDGRLDALVGTDSGAKLWLNRGSTDSDAPLFVEARQSFEPARPVGNRLVRIFSTAAANLTGLYLPHGSARTRAVFLSDLDGDGDPDMLIAGLWQAQIWWNGGQGEFQRSNIRLTYPEDTGLAVADFDGDGDPDIFSGRNEEHYRVWWNTGHGRFTAGKPWYGLR